jgi:small conductance mechanosensitive channel
MEAMIDQLVAAVVAWGPNVIASVAILILGWVGSRLVASGVRRAMTRARVDETLVKFIGNLVYMLVLTLVVIAVLGRLGINTTSLAAVVGAAGLAVGLAFQGTLANFAAGVLVLVFRPFKVGDFIEAAGVSGAVVSVELFTTVLNTPDNKRVIVGNGAVMSGPITNYSANSTRRVDMVFGISYTDDVEAARAAIQRILDADERVLSDPAPAIVVSGLADSSVNLTVRPWCGSADYWAVMGDVTERVKKAFDAEGISIPFPQREIRVVR